MEVKVVIGSSYGDEGKGLVSGCLAREAVKEHKKILTVFYNGTIQRAHSFGENIYHCLAAGTEFGSDTYYHAMFVIDPITIWLTQSKPIINPLCRVILPCDVLKNQTIEKERGTKRHGSCGFGFFAAVTRSTNPCYCVYAHELMNPYTLLKKMETIGEVYPTDYNEIYNLDNFMRAAAYITSYCSISDSKIFSNYDTIIYEGGQGLLLDQSNMDNFPHLTPSSVGLTNIAAEIGWTGVIPDFYYVSRTYITRHGAGPIEAECKKEDINAAIVDNVNQPNLWQGTLRFGYLNIESLYKRIQNDAAKYGDKANINLVFTQLNYTNNKLATTKGLVDIEKPNFCNKLFVSNDKTHMEEKE